MDAGTIVRAVIPPPQPAGAGGGAELGHAGVDTELELVQLAEFADAGGNVYQPLPGPGEVEVGVATRHQLAELGADDDQQIGGIDAGLEVGVDAEPGDAGVTGMAIVEEVLAAEGHRHRQLIGLGKVL